VALFADCCSRTIFKVIIKLPRWLLPTLVLLICVGGLAWFFYWDVISKFVATYEAQLKVLSLILGPIATIASIYWGYKSKQDLVDQSNVQAAEFSQRAQNLAQEMRDQGEALGTLRVQAEHAQQIAAQREREVSDARREIEVRRAEVEKLRTDLREITSDELWKLRPPKPFPQFHEWLRDPAGAKLITFGNLKGGVGKTTLAANFAAFLNAKKNKPVLLVDLDYQGSLSNMMMLANDMVDVESGLESLFNPAADLATLDRVAVHLVPKLPQSWLVPANYLFAKLENQLLLHWLLQEDGGLDVRFRLAHVLLRPDVRRKYAAIILDMPPRMAMGAVNALVASHYFVVPTLLDRLSAEAVGTFLTSMRAIKSELKLDIDLAGIAGVMTRNADRLFDTEEAALERAREGGQIWQQDRDYVFKTTIPRRVAIANAVGDNIAYLGKDGQSQPMANAFDPLFEEMCAAIWHGDGP
jgi:cellulose biosynthesis protein BcsQ